MSQDYKAGMRTLCKVYEMVITISKINAIQNIRITSEVLKGDIDTLHRFGISDKELVSVPEEHYGDLILEKIALVDIIK